MRVFCVLLRIFCILNIFAEKNLHLLPPTLKHFGQKAIIFNSVILTPT